MHSEQIKKETGLFIDDGGSGGLPIVFLHSLAGNVGQWSAQLDYFRQDRRALAIDLPGHGRSDSDGDYAIESMARKIRVAIREQGIERFVLVGHSMGGSVASAVAGENPEQLAALLLVDPSGDSTQMPQEEVQGYLGALRSPAYQGVVEEYWQSILQGSTDQTKAQVMKDLRQTAKETVVGVSEELFNFNPVPSLKRYDGPIFSLITRFNEFPNSLHNLYPVIAHVKIDGTGHWLQMDKPAEVNAVLSRWLVL